MIVGLREAARLIGAGGVVAVPTDTVYGLVCDPRSVAAVERVYAIKRRPAGLELGLLGATVEDLAACGEMGETATRLAAAFWPGGLSLIVPARPGAALAVPRHSAGVSLRLPGHARLRQLLALTGVLASTSANRHGRPAAADAAACEAELGADVDGIVDGGPAAGLGSTIIDLTTAVPQLLRSGPISAEALRPHLGQSPSLPPPPPAGT